MSCIEDAPSIFVMICRKTLAMETESIMNCILRKTCVLLLRLEQIFLTWGPFVKMVPLWEIFWKNKKCSCLWGKLNQECSWSWKDMKKSVQTNCSSIHNRNRKKWQYKENWLDSQRELLVPLKQMEILQLISAVPQFKYVRMTLRESFFRFVSPTLEVYA